MPLSMYYVNTNPFSHNYPTRNRPSNILTTIDKWNFKLFVVNLVFLSFPLHKIFKDLRAKLYLWKKIPISKHFRINLNPNIFTSKLLSWLSLFSVCRFFGILVNLSQYRSKVILFQKSVWNCNLIRPKTSDLRQRTYKFWNKLFENGNRVFRFRNQSTMQLSVFNSRMNWNIFLPCDNVKQARLVTLVWFITDSDSIDSLNHSET